LLDADNAQIPVGDSLQPVKAEIKMVSADYNFISTYSVKMKAGRNFFEGVWYRYFFLYYQRSGPLPESGGSRQKTQSANHFITVECEERLLV
jgi:hypothetical protein